MTGRSPAPVPYDVAGSAPDLVDRTERTPLPCVVVVTGTDTDVGKTITTAALAAAIVACGRSVAVHKPTQAGLDGTGGGDIDTVRRLAGVASVHEGVRLPEPMAPVAAAARAGVALPSVPVHRAAIRALADAHDHVLVEGAGGLLVELDGSGGTVADLATDGAAVVVCRAGLGTLNHTDLVLEALAHRRVPVAGLVIGSWPRTPSEIDLDNRERLARRAPLLGAVPEGACTLGAARFRALAPGWLSGVQLGVAR